MHTDRTARTDDAFKKKDCREKIKKFIKTFTGTYVSCMLFNMTTSSAYLSAISFQTNFLFIYYEIPYMTAKNLELFQPLFFITVVLVWIAFFSRLIKSDGRVLMLSSGLMTINFIKSYIFDQRSYFLAILHVVLHGIAGALYQSVFWAAVCKNLPKRYEGVAISLISLANNVMNSICPMISARIIGTFITKESAKYSLIMLIVLSSLGFLSASYFTYEEAKSLRNNTEINEDFEIIK